MALQKTYTIVVTREPLPERALTIQLDEPGTLRQKSPEYSEKNPVTKLKITGNIDARDLWELSNYDGYMYLVELDLSEANIVAYEGVAIPGKPSSYHPANEIPNDLLSGHTMRNATSITLPKTLTSIGNGVLNIYSVKENGSLTSIHIPEGVTKIDYGCFIGQNALTTISLPSTLTEIGADCFLNCNNLSVVVNHNPKPVETTCIFTCSSVGFGDDKPTLYVPYGSGNLYREATGWKEFNVVELPTIPDGGISITPSEDNALIAWEPLENATGYLLTIYKDEEHTQIERTVKFDVNGQFVEELRSGSVGVPFSFLLDGLLDGTTYYYTLETFATNDVLLFSQSGEFTTTGETVGVVETGCAPSLRSVTGYYSILGVKLSKEPASGMYIILYSDGTAVKMIK